MKSGQYKKILQIILQLVDEGVHVVDKNQKTIIYSEAMAHLEKVQLRDVLFKPFAKAFKHVDPEQSTLIQALLNKKSTTGEQQIYINNSGQQITTINSTIPVIDNGEVIAAIEVAKNITSVAELTQTIESLKKQINEGTGGPNLGFEDSLSLGRAGVMRLGADEIYYGSEGAGLDAHMEYIEKNIIQDAMILNNGNVTRAANYLKIKRQTLQHKLRKYDI